MLRGPFLVSFFRRGPMLLSHCSAAVSRLPPSRHGRDIRRDRHCLPPSRRGTCHVETTPACHVDTRSCGHRSSPKAEPAWCFRARPATRARCPRRRCSLRTARRSGDWLCCASAGRSCRRVHPRYYMRSRLLSHTVSALITYDLGSYYIRSRRSHRRTTTCRSRPRNRRS